MRGRIPNSCSRIFGFLTVPTMRHTAGVRAILKRLLIRRRTSFEIGKLPSGNVRNGYIYRIYEERMGRGYAIV